MQDEFGLYKKRVLRDIVREDVVPEHNHTMDALGYLAAYDPVYIESAYDVTEQNRFVRAWREIESKSKPESHVMYMGVGEVPETSAELVFS